MIKITQTITLRDDEIIFTATKATGPGGQHVNTTNSAVHLYFNPQHSPNIPPAILNRLKEIAGSRMTKDGAIHLKSRDARSQHRNKQILIERLIALIKEAATPPKKRKKTRPTKGSVTRRLNAKSQKSTTKKNRGKVKDFD